MSSRRDDAAAEQATVPKIAKRIWGPLTKDVSESIGAPAAVASVLLQPRCIPLDLVQKVHSLVPVEVLPSTDVSKKELAARLGKSDYLHPTGTYTSHDVHAHSSSSSRVGRTCLHPLRRDRLF